MRSRSSRGLLVSALLFAACSASDSEGTPTETVDDTAAAAAADTVADAVIETIPDTVADAAADTVADAVPDTTPDTTGGTEPVADRELRTASASIVDLLGTIPLSVYETARGDGAPIQIDLTDYSAASALAGLDRPSPSDFDASIAWLIELAQGESVERGGSGFGITPPWFPESGSSSEREVAAELGFSLFDIERSAALVAPPNTFRRGRR